MFIYTDESTFSTHDCSSKMWQLTGSTEATKLLSQNKKLNVICVVSKEFGILVKNYKKWNSKPIKQLSKRFKENNF